LRRRADRGRDAASVSLPGVYTIRPARYHPVPHPEHTSPKHKMRAEIEQLSDAAKQSIGLLRRHL
jgi:hypothetical protein